MASKTRTLKFKRTVNAPPAQVDRAFTNAMALREWLCNTAQADAHKGGRLYLWWNSGYYTSGEFTALTPGKKIAFTWHGRGEPAATRVQVALGDPPRSGGTVVTLAHSGVGTGKTWAKIGKEFARGWERALENLQSVLETGKDLRFVQRPLLGISTDDFNPEIAAKLGVPVTEGVRLDGVSEGTGAQAAGLQKDDVIVRLGRRKITGLTALLNALQGHRAGDKVSVVFCRGDEKKTVAMELSRRPLSEVPPTAEALADAVRRLYRESDAELAQCFQGVSEQGASHRPAPDKWSAKETVAHLIICERDNQSWIADLINDAERWTDHWQNPTNMPARIGATVSTFSTAPALLEELKRNEAETVAMLAALPAEIVAHKGTYWRLGNYLLQTPDHTRDHLKQIRAATEAARK